MSEITRIGADLAKNVIQVHAVDAAGKVVTSRALSRDKFMPWCAQLPQGCLIAMEASSSAHHWARKLVVLGLDARIIAAHLVALANKNTRILWAVLVRGKAFDAHHVSLKPGMAVTAA